MEEEKSMWPILIQYEDVVGQDKFELIWTPDKLPINKRITIKYINSSPTMLIALREGYLLGYAAGKEEADEGD